MIGQWKGLSQALRSGEVGGGGEIRTLGGLSPSLVFKTSAFNRSATPPREFHSTLPEYLGEC